MTSPPAERDQRARTIPCGACGAEAPLRFVARDVNRRLSTVEFPYYECRACGLLFLHPIPADLGRYYPADYYRVPRGLDDLRRAAELERYKIDLVRRFRSGGRLLEIGPAYGAFLHLGKEAGFEPHAIEMSPDCCRFLRDVVGAAVVESADPVAALARLPALDVVALWHVIEHVPDPWALLSAVAARLAPGGLVVIAAPNPGALQFRMTGRRWPHLDAPRHVALIPPALVERRASALGLSRVLLTTRDPGSIGWNAFGWEWFFKGLWDDTRFVTFGLRLLGRALARAMAPVERREGTGSAYTIVLEKGPER
jgi:2-polyprenyl-3-methyl-5-hydroxy-6-metoxy-1,4-benzoquinol methylase